MGTRQALAAAIVVALGVVPWATAVAQPLPPIKQVVLFGDSLTDAGTYWFRFTTNPGLTWGQLITLHYGQRLPLPNEHIDSYDQAYKGIHGIPGPGGLNYAEGGSKVNSPYSAASKDPEGVPISTVVQVQHYLAQHQNFTADQLVTLYIGTNDVAYDYDPGNAPEVAKLLRDNKPLGPEAMGLAKQKVIAAANDAVKVVKTILDHGTRRLLVFKLYDLANAPWFHSQAAQDYVHQLGQAFNATLLAGIPNDSRILVIDTEAFINGLIGDAAEHGFSHAAHEDACKEPDQDYCFPTTLAARDADEEYIFVAGEHMTTHANRLLADYVLKQLQNSPLQ